MPRVGLAAGDVVAAAASLADETGFDHVTMGLVAERLGVRPPSLYKHVADLADLQHRIAALAMTELGDAVRDATQGRAGLDALSALLTATPTVGARFGGEDDPLYRATARILASFAAVLRGYGIAEEEMDHAIRTIRCTVHGFAMLQASDGFQWTGEPDDSFDWMIQFIDRGLRGGRAGQAAAGVS
jgi:AcrR family transcriptional regulator